MTGYRLTTEQAELIRDKEFAPDSFFNPVPDINGDMFIFQIEWELAPRPEYDWFNTLTETIYTAPDYE
jgi:hypothetical protein